MKEDLEPLIKQLLALKVSYKDVTGDDFDPPKPEKKEKGPATQESKREGPSKTELNKLAKKAAKEKARAAEREAKGLPDPAQQQAQGGGSNTTDEALAHLYGDLPLIQSKFMTEKAYKQIYDVTEKRCGQQVWIRGRVSSSRAVGKGCFLVVRQGISTVQAVMFQGYIACSFHIYFTPSPELLGIYSSTLSTHCSLLLRFHLLCFPPLIAILF